MITNQPLLLDRLLKAGADPLLVDGSGNTALHIACKRGSLTCFGVITQNCQRRLTAVLSAYNYSGKRGDEPPPRGRAPASEIVFF